MSLTIQAEDPDAPEIRALLAAGEAYAAALYPVESNHFLDVAALRRPEVAFCVARRDGRAVGCGALVRQENGCGELKRIFVDDAARGSGVGRRILTALEDHARSAGLVRLRLETGVRSDPALALYRAAGYREIGPFGDYEADPFSVFMEKRL